MNLHDSEIISGILNSAGYLPSPNLDSADIVLIVSCAVREHAETRVLGRTAQIGGIRRSQHREKALLILCGCVAQEHGSKLLERFPDLDLVVGPDCYLELPELIEKKNREAAVQFGGGDYSEVEIIRKDFPRAFVTIMRGCNNYCAYCIVPYVRGRERSCDSEHILDEISRLSMDGFREITLLGQNVNSYNCDGIRFAGLLESAATVAEPARLRFVTSHPRDLNNEIIKVMSSHENICNQLHLPVQSGSNKILVRMKRGYSREEYLDKIFALREAMPEIVLSTDLIAGFPGETEAEFNDTVELLEYIRYDYAFLFKYSERTGTAASGMDNAIPEDERLGRLNHLQKIQRRITIEKSEELVGKVLDVLILGDAKGDKQQAARTSGNRVVILEGTSFPPGAFISVEITRADGWTHFAVPYVIPST